jgi:hypothetical protein
MKSRRALAALGFIAATSLVAATENVNPGWQRLKSLVGEWDGTYGGKTPVHVSYKLVSKGTALMEVISNADEPDMVTMYTADGGRLLMTHYCSEGNQPRMRADASAPEPGTLSFSFVDASNLPSPAASHMHHLDVVFKDANHFAQKWTHRADGKDVVATFEYARRK